MYETVLVTGVGGPAGRASASYFANKGYRVVGTGDKGNFQIPANMAKRYPAVFHLRLFGMNANGKVYSADRTYQLTQ